MKRGAEGMLAMETCSLFELPVDAPIFDGLMLVNISLQNDPSEDLLEKNQEQKVEEIKSLPLIPEVSDRMFCSTCQCGFYAREEQTEHYKLDWHRFNLKRRIVGGTSLTAEEFEERTCAGDLSSISGSDSDNSSEDEESGPSAKNEVEVNPSKTELLKLNYRARCPSSKFLFRNTQGQVIAIHQCVLGPAQDGPMDMDELVISLKSLQAKPCWVILMAGGGHFAGAIFRGNEVLEHKTFHRYTVRAKRGTSQGLRDSQSRSNMPKSAGASLRRYNEAALLKDVHDLLESWSQHLRDAKSIFLRAPSHNKTLFFSKKNSPLQKNDPRVFNVPFVTRRATFKEVQRIHAVLSTLQVYGKDTLLSDISSPAKKNWKKVNKEVPKEELPSENIGSSPIPSEDDDIVEGEMEMVEVVLDTLALREFEVLPKRNHKKKKKAGKKSGRDFSALDLSNKDTETFLTSMTDLAPETAGEQEIAGHKRMPKSQRHCGIFQETDDASYQLRNDLFTACKTGDIELLHCLLQDVVGISSGTTTPHQANIPSISNPPESLSGMPTPDSAPKPSSKGSNKNGDQISCETKEVSADHHDYPKNPVCEMRHTKELVSAYAPQASSLLNERIDNGGFTLLHVAAASGQSSVLSLLMDAGWDPAVRDELGQTPYSVSSDKQTRNAFRKYSAEHPSKYNYIKAQMPAPLTAELEAKKEEKKRAQKMLKKQREKAEKEEKKRKEEEEEEKKRFAALSDREKVLAFHSEEKKNIEEFWRVHNRALAAEKRFAAQMTTSGTAITNTRRCWQCGEALLSRIPFEYLDFSFCSTRCLQEHRKVSRPAKS